MGDFNALAVKQGVLFSLLRYVSFFLSFFGQLLLVRILVPEDFGQYVVLVSLIEIVCAVTLSGIQHSAIKFQNSPFVFENSFGLAILSSIITMIISLIIFIITEAIFDFENARNAFVVLTLTKALAGFSSVYTASLLKDMNFTAVGLVAIYTNILGIIVGLIMASVGYGFLALVGREVVVSWLNLFLLGKAAKLKLRPRFDVALLKEMFLFIKSLLLVTFSSVLVLRSPSLVFGFSESKAFIGAYDRTFYLSQLPNTLLSPVLSNFSFTLFSTIANEHEKIKKVLELQIFVLSRAVLPIFLVFNLHQELIVLMLGSNWVDITDTVKHFSLLVVTLPLLNLIMQYHLSIGISWPIIVARISALGFLFLSYGLYKLGHVPVEFIFFSFSLALFFSMLWVMKSLFSGDFRVRCLEILGLYLSILIFPSAHLYIICAFFMLDIYFNRVIYQRMLSMKDLLFKK